MRSNFNLIKEKINELYAIINDLAQNFPGRPFTLDGHLVGSIGEVLASLYYGLELMPPSCKVYDAISKDGKKVQIKTTQIDRIGISSEPEHLIVLHLQKNGDAAEIYNGPGKPAWEMAGKLQKNGQRSIYLSKLKKLMAEVTIGNRLERIG